MRATSVPVLLVALVGCSDDATPSTPNDTGVVDAVADAADTAVDAPVEAGPRTRQPLLVSSNVVTDPGDRVGDTNLIFLNAGAPPCPHKEIGPCHTWACGPRGADAVVLDAGVIGLAGGAKPLSIKPGSDGAYSVDRPVGVAAWKAGDTLTFSASGGADIPTFSQVLVAPPPLVLTTPSAGPSDTVWTLDGVDRASGLSIAWSAPLAGDVGVSVLSTVATKTAIDGPRVACRFDAAAGKATIPAEALAVLGSGKTATAIVGAEARAEITPGGHRVVLRVGNAHRIDVTFK